MSNPDSSLEACTESLRNSKVTVKRGGRRATFDNGKHAAIQCVDLDCWLPANEARADYVLAKPGVADVIVELKGKDIDHAARQIVATLGAWKQAPPFSEKVGGLIVFTRSPKAAAEIGELKKRMLKQHGLWMEIDKDQKTEYRFETFTGRKA